MGSGSRVISVVFRLMQLVSAAVVAGTLGHYLYNIHEAGVGSNGRVVLLEAEGAIQLGLGPTRAGLGVGGIEKGSIVVVFDTRNGRRGSLPPGAPTE
ncbi:hypothetical protein V500_00476 [Pseudogymnoascus sp. VKM F-4518 (FW-2643)]|nr:hypothetical protein V500_00476 [Pseudogymnoascus sp. VKM F-4518 (FW-2643)]